MTETQGSTKVLDIFNILTGKCLFSGGGEHTRGFRMIYGIVVAIKTTCVEIIPKIYIGVVDSFVRGCSPHSFFRKILGGMLLPFLLFMFLFHLHISKGILPYLRSGQELWTMLYFSFLVMAVINFAILMITRAHDLNNKEDRVQIEEIVNKDVYLSKKAARCSRCEIPNVLRSFHCPTCDLHVAKYHDHSKVLNKCIGAGNLLPYTTFQFFLFVLFFFGAIFLRLQKTEDYTPKRTQKFLNNLIYLFCLCFAFGRFISLLKNLACIYFNITLNEITNWQQLGYLWKNPRKEFFNPFDKGPIQNIKEEVYTAINFEESGKKNLNESTEEMQLRDNIEDPDEKERKGILLEKAKIRNWRTEKITNITEIYSSPMRKIFMEFIKKKTQPKKKGSDSDSDDDE